MRWKSRIRFLFLMPAVVWVAGLGCFAALAFTGIASRSLRKLLADTGLVLTATYSGGNFIFDDILPEELARVTRADRLGDPSRPTRRSTPCRPLRRTPSST